MRDGSRFPETRAGGCKHSVERESHAGAERRALPLPHLHAGGGVASFATRIASLIIVLCEAIESERRRGRAAAGGGGGGNDSSGAFGEEKNNRHAQTETTQS